MDERLRSADVVVVGAGHNGLVSAAYLTKADLDVLVVEADKTPGGMASTNAMAPEAQIAARTVLKYFRQEDEDGASRSLAGDDVRG